MSIAMAGDRSSAGPPALSPRDAMERFLNHKATSVRDSTLQTYYNRLDLFAFWCERRGIETLDELDGWTLDEYETYRSGITAPITLQKEMNTLRNFLEYLERIEVVEEGLGSKVHVPDVDPSDKTSEKRLEAADAMALLEYYRGTPAAKGTRRHVFLEIAWCVGARMGGIRALDVRDVDTEENFVEFHDRESQGTGLKNGPRHHPRGGERFVGIPEATSEAIERYIDRHRDDVHDEYGRQPLLTTKNGRIHGSNLRNVSYHATLPCLHGPCPHGKDSTTCKWTYQKYASKCPSSRSPHHIRTGSIMWQLDRGLPIPVVAERVNASVSTIEDYYDHRTPRRRMEQRRDDYVGLLGFGQEADQE